MIISFYDPDGSTELRPAHDHPRPDRSIKIPINIVIIDDFSASALSLPYLPAPNYNAPGPSNPRPPTFPPSRQPSNNVLQPRQAFEIYMDNRTPNTSQNSSTSNTSNPLPDLTATLKSGLILDKITKAVDNTDTGGFSLAASSTETPPGQGQTDVKTSNKTPNKTPNKSRKGLRKTPSQPAITDYTVSDRSLPSPIPTSLAAKRKRILQVIDEQDQRLAKKNIFPSKSVPSTLDANDQSIMADDKSITKVKSKLDQSAMDFFANNLPDNQQILDLKQLQSTSTI